MWRRLVISCGNKFQHLGISLKTKQTTRYNVETRCTSVSMFNHQFLRSMSILACFLFFLYILYVYVSCSWDGCPLQSPIIHVSHDSPPVIHIIITSPSLYLYVQIRPLHCIYVAVNRSKLAAQCHCACMYNTYMYVFSQDVWIWLKSSGFYLHSDYF